MNFLLVALVYALSALTAVALLYYFRPRAWYLHALSLAVAFTIGLMPPPQGMSGRSYDLTVGFLFFFFLIWGLGGFLMRVSHRIHA